MSLTDPTATILVIEDDPATRTFLADNLTADGYELLVADCGQEAVRLLECKFPDLVLLDLGLPDAAGLDLVGRVRSSDGVASRIDPAVPLLVVTGRAGELDRLRGFERGCDDYVCKPFSYPELRLRVRALLRRAELRRRPGRVRVGDLEVDAAARIVRLRGATIELSQKEFALVRSLASDPTRVFTKEELLRTIWGFRTLGSTRTLDSHACRLRNKLGRFGDRFVVNVWGVGYRLVDGPVSARDLRPEELPAPAWPLAPAAALAPAPLLVATGPLHPVLLLAWATALAVVGVAALLVRELRRRAELVARACHELRGPLTAAHLALHAGARRGEGPPERLAAVDLELRRAGVALDDLDAARRGRRGGDREERVDVGDLLAHQASTWRAVASTRGCELALVEPAAGAAVRGDRLRLAQAVGNLVGNALEHGSGRVELLGRSVGDRVRIEVADEGPGLPAPVGDLTRRARSGRGRRGRGLAIASDIADRHGGRLVAAPAERGTRMALELPAWPDEH
ncbi:MAG: two-component system, OmpR family, response regulator [Solirubrobacteraceae bacterium]|jgi:DNA-binding response OmpR family regulator|nr:two-component system, OmpR family, response regulator [Solirubrobacteraceae bacterium]